MRQLKGHPNAPNPLQLWLYGLLRDSWKLTLAGSDPSGWLMLHFA
jgi:hypothetical protein